MNTLNMSTMHANSDSNPNPMDGAPWWEQAWVKTMSVSDYVVRSSASAGMVAATLPHYNKIFSSQNIGSWDFYTDPKLFKAPSLFFKRCIDLPDIERRPARMKGFEDAVVEDLFFQSPFRPVNPSFKPILKTAYQDMPASAARFVHHGDGPRPTIICVHGFLFDDYEFMSYFFGSRGYYDMGFDLLLYTLPFHGPRKLKRALYNGDGFFLLDAGTINENVAFTIFDLQIFISYLKNKGIEKLGVSGISLGGYHSALITDLDERIDFSINKIPIVSMWDLVLSWEPSGSFLKRAMRGTGKTNEDIRNLMAIHSPLSHKARVHPDNLFMVGAKGDRMVETIHTMKLWQHWGEPEIYWYPGTHTVHTDRSSYLKSINQFLKKQLK